MIFHGGLRFRSERGKHCWWYDRRRTISLVAILSAALVTCSCSGRQSQTPRASAAAAAVPAAPVFTTDQIHDVNAFLKSLPDATVPAFTEGEALALVAMPLACIDHPQANPATNPFSSGGYLWAYPSEPRLIDRYDRNRAFYGCYDWHSAVNSTWTMVQVLKDFPKIPVASLIREKLSDHLGKGNIQGELAYFKKAQRFELPFGRSWLLKLEAELLGWKDSDGKKWEANVAPLAKYFAAGLAKYLEELPDPTRIGEHANTAYSMNMMLDYSAAAHDAALQRAVFDTARRFYLHDSDCPTAYEPAGASFLSPCLEEAKVMTRVLDRTQFASWFHNFVPPVYSAKFSTLVHPFDATHITDPKLLAGKSHLIGLGLFRGEAMLRIADALPANDPLVPVYRRLANINAEKSFEGFGGAGYLGSHWMGTYAVLYELAARTEPQRRFASDRVQRAAPDN